MATIADIEKLTAWLSATDIAMLELRGAGGTVRLTRRDKGIDVHRAQSSDEAIAEVPGETIIAKTPGVFLHGHPLRQKPLAGCGSEVKVGDMVGLLRIGSLLLPVRAPRDGVVEGYWAEDGAAVGYGAPLVELAGSEIEL